MVIKKHISLAISTCQLQEMCQKPVHLIASFLYAVKPSLNEAIGLMMIVIAMQDVSEVSAIRFWKLT